MHYEINVARYKNHFFATHDRSIKDLGHLLIVLAAIVKAFPKSEGYSVSVSEYRNEGRSLDIDALLPPAPPETRSQEACPGCGAEPGDGCTAGCNHPEGCGFFAAEGTR